MEDIKKVGATRVGLAVPKTIPHNSGTTAPGSSLMMTDVETNVAAPIPFVLVYRQFDEGGDTVLQYILP